MLDELLKGVSLKVYEATTGTWHGHVTLAFDMPREWLDNAPYGRPVSRETPTNGLWTDIGYCESEQQALDRCCAVIGHVAGHALARELGPQEIPATVVPGKRRMEFT